MLKINGFCQLFTIFLTFSEPLAVKISGNLTAIENSTISLKCNYTNVNPPGNSYRFVIGDTIYDALQVRSFIKFIQFEFAIDFMLTKYP